MAGKALALWWDRGMKSVDSLLEAQAKRAAEDAIRNAPRPDSAYVAYSFWEEKGIDLASMAARNIREDEDGNPAVILHGWMSKRNKSGLRGGALGFQSSLEKDRYFVLTVNSLCFFLDETSAAVEGGYVKGKCSGKSIGGFIKKTGASLPLESVCDIKLLSTDEELRSGGSQNGQLVPSPPSGIILSKETVQSLSEALVTARAGKPASLIVLVEELVGEGGFKRWEKNNASKLSKAQEDIDSEEDTAETAPLVAQNNDLNESLGEDEGSSSAVPSPREGFPVRSAKSSSKLPPAAPPKPTPAKAAEAAPNKNSGENNNSDATDKGPLFIIDIDFGEFSLLVNAHNGPNRQAWVSCIKKWSSWKKKIVDQEIFNSMGGAKEDIF